MKEKQNYIFGIRAIIEAIKSDKTLDKLLMKRGARGELMSELMQLCRQLQVPVQYVPGERLDRITRKNHQGAIAYLSEVAYHDTEQLIPGIFESGKTPLILILDGISDVRNFGAIARSASCAGVDLIIVPQKGSAQINADAIKTSAGALHEIPVSRVANLTQTVKFLRDSGIQIIAATEKAESMIYTQNLTLPTAIIMGAEDLGISKELLRVADYWAKVPITGKIGSLNVSAAASLFIFEAVRQRI